MCSVFDSNYGRHLPVARDARILDIGCGSGRMLAFLESRGYTNFLGVDIDAGVLLQVPGHLQDRTMQITDLSAFLHEHSEIFDLILAKDVLYYFSRHEVTQRMLEIAQAIRPGGRIVVEVFNGAVLTATYTAAKDVGILAIYTEQSIRTLLEGAGLHVTEVYGQRPGRGGVLRPLYNFLAGFWKNMLRLIYVLERGIDPNNPKILEKSLLAVAHKTIG